MKRVWGFLVLIFLISFISASYSFGDYSIESHYGSLSNIKGWINMSFTDESTQSVFTDSFGNEIPLIKVLESNDNINYVCSTNDCGFDYSAFNGNPNVPLNLNIGSEKLMGFLINEDINAINSVNFVVESDTEKSCYNQLTFDFGADGTVESGNTNPSFERCPFLKSYGCYDEGNTESEYQISQSPNKHCQGINLTESAGFNIGAWIDPAQNSEIGMSIYNTEGEQLASCDLGDFDGGGEYDCEVDYLVTTSEKYYVCVYAKNEVGEGSKIKGYVSEEGCGFYGEGIQPESASFKIFAETRKFDNIGTMNITNSLPQGNSLAGEINDYLISKYGALDCSKGCIIPFKIHSNTEQNVVLKDLELKYETNLGQAIGNNFYEIEGTPSTVSMGNQKVYIDEAGFKTPYENGALNYTLNFGDEEVLSTEIYVEEISTPRYVLPTKTASAFPTTFKVLTDSSNISVKEYTWEFGDNTTATTTTNEVVHAYENVSNYEMTVTIEDFSGRTASGKFDITVSSPVELIEETISEMSAEIETISSNIAARELFHQTAIKSVIDIDEISDEFKQIQRDYQTAQTEEEYNAIVKRLLDINIPNNLIKSMQAENFPFFPKSNVINLDVLKTIAGGDYEEDKERYVEAIRTWQQENLNIKVDFEEVSGIYDERQEGLVRIFKLNMETKEDLGSDVYIIMKDMENLLFKDNYLEENQSGYIFIDMKDPTKTIEFSTTEDIDFADLPLFVSPSLERLDLIEPPSSRIINMKWSTVIIIFIIIFILGLATYIFLQEWYKRKYENYLFEKRNDLYNLIVYAKSSKEKGMDNGQIKTKLKKQGWSGEQVDYVIRKYLGKRTGMIEIPISKVIDKIKDILSKKKNMENQKKVNPNMNRRMLPPQKRVPIKGATPPRKI